jgi:hypothetical protein
MVAPGAVFRLETEGPKLPESGWNRKELSAGARFLIRVSQPPHTFALFEPDTGRATHILE